MRAGADNRRLGFQGTCDVQDILPERLIRPARVEISKHPGNAFDASHVDLRKSRLLELVAQVFRTMEVRRREVVECVRWIPMLPIDQVLVAYSQERRIEDLAGKTIECGRIPRNRGDHDGPWRRENAMRLT